MYNTKKPVVFACFLSSKISIHYIDPERFTVHFCKWSNQTSFRVLRWLKEWTDFRPYANEENHFCGDFHNDETISTNIMIGHNRGSYRSIM